MRGGNMRVEAEDILEIVEAMAFLHDALTEVAKAIEDFNLEYLSRLREEDKKKDGTK